MQPPQIPDNEPQRLRSLHLLGILGTPAEERFDVLTRLAQRALKVPIALVSLVDDDRQWFKSRQGLAVTETPRDISFCGHAILNDGIFIVPDTAQDSRFHDNPLVTGEPRIRFYAGCPLSAPDGQRVGTLCVIDTRPRALDAEDKAMLSDLASLAERELAVTSMVVTDSLTGLYNRCGFEAAARIILKRCERDRLCASLLFFDLDNFKRINDDHGHDIGDKALCAFAALMQDVFRESDVLARLSGDEFVALTAGAEGTTTEGLLQRVDESLQAWKQKHRPPYSLGYSVGTAESRPEDPQTLATLLSRADSLMYAQKKQLPDHAAKGSQR